MSPKSTGRYITTTVAGESVEAFVPDLLPPPLGAEQLATLKPRWAGSTWPAR